MLCWRRWFCVVYPRGSRLLQFARRLCVRWACRLNEWRHGNESDNPADFQSIRKQILDASASKLQYALWRLDRPGHRNQPSSVHDFHCHVRSTALLAKRRWSRALFCSRLTIQSNYAACLQTCRFHSNSLFKFDVHNSGFGTSKCSDAIDGVTAMVNSKLLLWIGVSGPAILLIAAFGFEHLGGLKPCALCIWQRWPHAVAVVLAMIFVATRHPAVAALAALTFFAGTLTAGFHAGVEQGWWSGLATCEVGSDSALDRESLLDFASPVSVVRCDEIAWRFLGLSMAVWNGLASAALCVIWAILTKNSIHNRRKTAFVRDA